MKMNKFTIATVLFLILGNGLFAQEAPGSVKFWENLKKHCGKSYEGEVLAGKDNEAFMDKRLVMHVRSCDGNVIRIPFFVGDDRSRTWVFTLKNEVIQLKHDHRKEDGSDDEITQYGGTSTNTGVEERQFFPADQETADLIAYASHNVWWVTLDENSFSYNLRRLGTDRLFTVQFDLTKEVEAPPAPWGWSD